jgi:sulfate permease, SulP family
MHRYRHLMVGLARAESDAELIRYAARVARLGTADVVRFVHVLPGPGSNEHDRSLAELQAETAPHFTGVPEGTRVSYHVLHGPLLDQLLTFVADMQIDLLLVGHGLEDPGRRALARRLAMKAPCSVWMVPEGAPPDLRRILVPIDFSEHSADSLRVATSMARLSGRAECLALHVYFDEAVITYEGYARVLRGQEQQAYRQFVAPIDCQGVTVTPLFEEGPHIASVIARVAERHQADLIVMATRGRSRSAAILLGSVTEEMIIQARVPLLAVKHFGARMGVLQALLDRRFRHGGELHTD